MGVDLKGQRFCDECGNPMAKAQRIEGDREYCAACYKRCFIKACCPACSGSMRVLARLPLPEVCDKCARATRRCVRCTRLTPRAGMKVAAGVLCGSCAKHFRQPEPCERCGRGSRELSTHPKHGIADKICRECFRKQTHATCLCCGKNRLVAGHDSQGRPLCVACERASQDGTAPSHPCPRCGAAVEGTGASSCRHCLNLDRLRRIADAGMAQLESRWVRQRWTCFVREEGERDEGDAGLALDVERSLEFFRHLERTFPGNAGPSPVEYAERVGSQTMRKFLRASRSVAAVFDCPMLLAEGIEEASERRRIEAILADASGRPYEALACSYEACLEAEGVATRTRRQYLRAAVDFCESLGVDGSKAWAADAALRYLRRKPGQHANLMRWHGFFGASTGLRTTLPSRHQLDAPVVSTGKQVRRLRRAIGEARELRAERATTRTLARMFSAMFAIPAAELVRRRGQARQRPDGAIEVIPGAVIGTESSHYPLASRWLTLFARSIHKRTVL